MKRMTFGDAASQIVEILRDEYRFTDRTIIEWILTERCHREFDEVYKSPFEFGTREFDQWCRNVMNRLIQSELHVVCDCVDEWSNDSDGELDDDGMEWFEGWIADHGTIPPEIAKVPESVRNVSWQDRPPIHYKSWEWADDLIHMSPFETADTDFSLGVLYSLRPGLTHELIREVMSVCWDLSWNRDFLWT